MPGHGGLATFANQEIGAGESAIMEVEVDPAASRPARHRARPKKWST